MLHLEYKGKCIEIVRDALSEEQLITDAIITLALMLVAEAVRFQLRQEAFSI